MGDMTDPRYDTSDDELDFSEGEDGADAFDRYVRTALGEYQPVPEPPREAMWAQIDRARRGRRGQPVRRFRGAWPRVLVVGAGLVAMLALGIGIGRNSALLTPAGSAGAMAGSNAVADGKLPYRMAAVQHLSRTEALLTALPAGGAREEGATEEVAAWAGDLLSQTRLLLDSPAGEDPELGHLLSDLELLLAQVAALSAGRAADDLDLIRDGMNQNDVMLRLRTATTQRPFAGT
jgi:hypothetical protein